MVSKKACTYIFSVFFTRCRPVTPASFSTAMVISNFFQFVKRRHKLQVVSRQAGLIEAGSSEAVEDPLQWDGREPLPVQSGVHLILDPLDMREVAAQAPEALPRPDP